MGADATDRQEATVLRMFAAQRLTQDLQQLAQAQAGLLARDQLLLGGLSRTATARLAADWETLSAGVYRVYPAVNEDARWQSRLWLGLLIAEPRGTSPATPGLPAIGGLAAAAQYGLVPRTELMRHPSDKLAITAAHDIDVYVGPRRVVRAAQAGYRFVRSRHPGRARFSEGDLTVTSIEDTALDVLELLEPSEVADWIDRACRYGMSTPERLLKMAMTRSRLANRDAMMAILQDQVEGVTSTLERVFRDEVERPHGLPEGRRQVRDGNRVLDVLHDCVVIELDGRAGHVGEGRWRDRRRDNSHTVRGRYSLRYGWQDCTYEPCLVAWEVGGLLVRTGWQGRPTPCPNCPPDLVAAQVIAGDWRAAVTAMDMAGLYRV